MSITTTPRNQSSTWLHTGSAPEVADPRSRLVFTIMHATHSRGVLIEHHTRDGLEPVGVSCGDRDCIVRTLDRRWHVVPARTDLLISAWPAPGDECSCRQDEIGGAN